AGSLLHIIASSTSVYQREILKADNSKVALIQQDYQKKREALDYKERALRGREAHLEALQQELEDQAKELKTKFIDVTSRETAIEKGTKDLREIDRSRRDPDSRTERMGKEEPREGEGTREAGGRAADDGDPAQGAVRERDSDREAVPGSAEDVRRPRVGVRLPGEKDLRPRGGLA